MTPDTILKGELSFYETCIERTRPMQVSDLISLTKMVAAGLHDRTRQQQNFPDNDHAQFGVSSSPAVMMMPKHDTYRKNQIINARHAYEHASEVFWSTGDKLPALRSEIEQHAFAIGINPDDMLAAVIDGQYYDFACRVEAAVEEISEARTNEKKLQHARIHLERQLRKTPGHSMEADNTNSYSM